MGAGEYLERPTLPLLGDAYPSKREALGIDQLYLSGPDCSASTSSGSVQCDRTVWLVESGERPHAPLPRQFKVVHSRMLGQCCGTLGMNRNPSCHHCVNCLRRPSRDGLSDGPTQRDRLLSRRGRSRGRSTNMGH